MNTRLVYWLVQIVGWTSYAFLSLLAIYSTNPKDITPRVFINLFVLILFGVIVTNVQRYVFIKSGWLDLKLGPLVPRVFVSSVISAIVIQSLLTLEVHFVRFISGDNEPVGFSNWLIGVFSLTILVLFWNAIYVTYHLFQKSRKQEISNLALTASNRESELKNLRSQLNPHFLFNALNTIRALVDIDPAKSKKSITTLSNLLRQSLILGKENLVPISSELEIVKSYLELEKIRFEERLNVVWEIDDRLMQEQIPSFVVQMMTENAIKHGISSLKEGGTVIISVRKESGCIVLEVSNSGEMKTETDLGVGIQNIQQRLHLQFGSRAYFKIVNHGKMVVAKIVFDHEKI